MQNHEYRNEGVVLLAALLLMLIVLGLTASLVAISVTEAKALTESENRTRAFYLAEAGVEAAQMEIAESEDSDGDGIGNRSLRADTGTYTVAAEDLGLDTYRLTSTGKSRQSTVVLEAVVGFRAHTQFPRAAVSVVGSMDLTHLTLHSLDTLVVEGGDAPAFSMNLADTYTTLGETIAAAIATGTMPATNISGTPLNPFASGTLLSDGTPAETQLPISQGMGYDSQLEDLTALYDQLLERTTTSIIPSAEVIRRWDVRRLLWNRTPIGTPENPKVVYFPERVTIDSGRVLKGHGTLVIGNELIIKEGATLDWDGHIIVTSATKNGPKLVLDHGNLVVDGSLTVLAGHKKDADLKITSGSTANITGAVMLGTSHTDLTGKKTRLSVEQSQLRVDGVVTVFGNSTEVEFASDAAVSVSGALQIGSPEDLNHNALKLDFDGDIELSYDEDKVQAAVEALSPLADNWDLPELGRVLSMEMVKLSWQEVSH